MATVYLRGRSYVLQWTDQATGEQKRVSLGRVTKKEAHAQLHAKELALATGGGTITGPNRRAESFSSFAEEYLAWHEGEYPAGHYRVKQLTEQHLVPFFGTYSLDEIDEHLGEKYKTKRRRSGDAAGTIAKELRTLRAVINRAVRWKRVAKSGLAELADPKSDKSKPPPFYTVEQLADLYLQRSRYTTLWRLLANTGLRRTEILQQKKVDVLANDIRVLSDTGARTKSAKWRTIPLSPGARSALQELQITGDEYLIPRITKPSLSRAFARDAKRAGIGGSIHWLRHTFCSHLVMRGTPLRTVQKLAGHSTIAVTEQYAHLAPGHMQDSVKGLDL